MSGCRICRGLSGFVRGCVAYCVYDCVVSPRNLQGMFSTPLGRVGFPRGQVTHSTEIVHAIQPTGYMYTESASKVASNTTVCCKGYKLPIDNNGELFRWTSNCQLISNPKYTCTSLQHTQHGRLQHGSICCTCICTFLNVRDAAGRDVINIIMLVIKFNFHLKYTSHFAF